MREDELSEGQIQLQIATHSSEAYLPPHSKPETEEEKIFMQIGVVFLMLLTRMMLLMLLYLFGSSGFLYRV